MRTFHDNPINVLGDVLKVGDKAPNFSALNQSLEVKSLNDFSNKHIILNVVPSLDTGVCDAQTRKLNEELAKLDDVLVITLSNDLPFAQKRWCGAAGLDNVITLSDHKDLDFANKYGVNIKELRLLARSVFVLDENRNIVYVEYVNEMTDHIKYDELLNFVKGL